MNEIKMYQCEHCLKKVYYLKSSAKRHEDKCYWNDKMRSCMTCKHYQEPDETTKFKVVGEETMCEYARDNGLNYKCEHWEKPFEYEE